MPLGALPTPQYSASVDIEEFYDADPQRRSSPEVELGTEWHDAHGVRYELSWVQDTGELYVMREPVPETWEDPFGDFLVQEASVDNFTVAVVGRVTTHDELEEVLAGWQEAMREPNGVAWIADRLRAKGVGGPPGGQAATRPPR